LNEVVVSKGDIARMGDFAVELDGKTVARFRADGVIVSTPTGSTAYTLAANGPILTPDVDAMVVTPICPHLLTLRPIVVRGDASLTVRVEGAPNQAQLTVDGQKALELHLGDEVRCQRSSYTVNLVRLSERAWERGQARLPASGVQFGQQHFGLERQGVCPVHVAGGEGRPGLLEELPDLRGCLQFLIVQRARDSVQPPFS
jgi:NAD kinase